MKIQGNQMINYLKFSEPLLNKIIDDTDFDLNLKYNLNRILWEKHKRPKTIRHELELPIKYKGYFQIEIQEKNDEATEGMKRKIKYECSVFNFDYKHRFVNIRLDNLSKLLRHFYGEGNFNNYTIPRLVKQENIIWTNYLLNEYPLLREQYYRSGRKDIYWTFELIEEFKDKISWISESIEVTFAFLDWPLEKLIKYKDYINFNNSKNFDNLRYGSFSSAKFIKWDINILEALFDKWNWEELSLNSHIKWDEKLIDKFIDKLYFKNLSQNIGIEWNEALITKYFDKWDWEQLSGNSSLCWSYEFILKFENKWQWKPKHDFTNKKEYHDFPSISTNKNIFWDIKLFEKFIDEIDVWSIAYNGKICNELLFRYKSKFDIKKLIGWKNHDYSDFMTVTEKLYSTGWENLSKNPHFKIKMDNIDFLINNYVEITYVDGNLCGHGGGKYITKEFKLIEVLRNNEIENISELLENDNQLKYFYNENFINDSYWKSVIKPYLLNNLDEFMICIY